METSFMYASVGKKDKPEKKSFLQQQFYRELENILFEEKSKKTPTQFLAHPIRTIVRGWYMSSLQAQIRGSVQYAIGFKNIIDKELTTALTANKLAMTGEQRAFFHGEMLKFLGQPGNYYRLQDLHDFKEMGYITDKLWRHCVWQRRFSEIDRFRRTPLFWVKDRIYERTIGYKGLEREEEFDKAFELFRSQKRYPAKHLVKGKWEAHPKAGQLIYKDAVGFRNDPFFSERLKRVAWRTDPKALHPLHKRGVLNRFTPRKIFQPLMKKFYGETRLGKGIQGFMYGTKQWAKRKGRDTPGLPGRAVKGVGNLASRVFPGLPGGVQRVKDFFDKGKVAIKALPGKLKGLGGVVLMRLSGASWTQTASAVVAKIAKTAVVKAVKSAVTKIVKSAVAKAVKVIVTKAIAAVVAAIGTAIPVIGTILGWIAGEIIGRLVMAMAPYIMNLVKLSVVMSLGSILVITMAGCTLFSSAFTPVGGGDAPTPPGGSAFLEVIKTADPPGPFENLIGGKTQEVTYQISVRNKVDEPMTNIKINDTGYSPEYNKECDLGSLILHKGEESDPSLCTFKVTLKDIEDTIVDNAAAAEATVAGETVASSVYFSIIVGTPPSTSPCGSAVAAKAKEIVHDWPTGEMWRTHKVCDPPCTDRGCQKIGVCYMTGRGSDYYSALNCRGMVCTDLVVAAYDVADCDLPAPADSRWSGTIWEAFSQTDLGLDRYLNGGGTPPEIGDILFYGVNNRAIYHVSIITEVRSNGLIMHQANSRKCRFVPEIGVNRYEGYDATHKVIGWGRMLQK